jgi:ribosomal protein RSM22 (predicted rRNA methylase)
MLDLGGGPGLVGIALVAAHPEMKGVIFDKPAIVKVAETFIKEYEMEDRMEVLGGDYSRDPIGKEYDLIWASGYSQFCQRQYGLAFEKDLRCPQSRRCVYKLPRWSDSRKNKA